jgi:hypothetical protein
MVSTLALVTLLSLAPGQSDQLQLTNAHATYGVMGPPRPNNQVLPGEVFWVTYDIENLAVDAGGEVRYSMGMELFNSKGKREYGKDPQELKAYNFLGGTTLPAFANTQVGTETPPGEYTLKVTVIDLGVKPNKTATLERKFEVLPKKFGIVNLHLTYDGDGRFPAPGTGVAGQTFFINFWTTGFERDKTKKQPDIVAELRILDDKDKPTLAKPLIGTLGNEEVPAKAQQVFMQYTLPLNRTGKFSVQLKVTDQVSKKTTELSFPITVLDSK